MKHYDERRYHDMGGLEAGPIDLSEHEHPPWEKKAEAILSLIAHDPPIVLGETAVKKGPIIRVDEQRRAMEEFGPGEYDELTYYERWIAAVAEVLIADGFITVDELGQKMADIERRRNEGADQ